MAQQVKQATHSHAVQDGADTDALIPSGFSHYYGTNGIYLHDPHDLSTSSGANDKDSSTGSPNEANGELQLTILQWAPKPLQCLAIFDWVRCSA